MENSIKKEEANQNNFTSSENKQAESPNKSNDPKPFPVFKVPLPDNWSFEVIKSGISLEIMEFPLKEFLVLGRLPVCDIQMEHPSISRYHAIIQFNDKGEIFLYDLDSAHGTIINKQRILSQSYIKLRVGDQLKFGESTRTYILLGPEEPQPELPEPKRISKPLSKSIEESGVNWGFAEDAEDEGEMNVSAAKESWKRDEDAYYYKDPKKALRNWLENRGYDLDFENEQEGPGHSRTFTARIRLPDVEDAYGPVYGTGSGSKRKDAEKQASIDACEKLDMLGLLRASQDEASARKKRIRDLLGDNDEDDDNDTERAKLRKIQQPQKVETYESLTKQREELAIKIEETRNKISFAKEFEKLSPAVAAEDDLDTYMDSINNDLKGESAANLEAILQELLKQDQRLAKLIEITKPLDIMQSNSIILSSSKSDVANNNAAVSAIATNTSLITEPNIKINVEKKQQDTLIPSSNKFKVPISTINFEQRDKFLNVQPTKESSTYVSQKRLISSDKEEINNEEEIMKTTIPMTPQEYEENQENAKELNEIEIEEATVWEPPKGQTGDGRTALNDKYGY
ncbi:19101_t:CDS:10 [Funneliformis geosporum]|uniref:19101_t:CDS:1 n=1 Tax=Funneliformis geosporum TaxID=1117311 RepID=A0A9W4SLI5_9GLOM|nr:19101_t:CDS:10 [Funneliformis geosporum]